MHSRRLMPWMLVLGLAACRSEPDYAPGPIDPPMDMPTGTTFDAAGGSGGSGGSGSSPGDAGPSGAAGANANDGGRSDTGIGDGGPDTPKVVIYQDAQGGNVKCANNRATVGSNRLLAGGATPADFAAAYNAALLASNTAGPLLFAFRGVNETNLLGFIAWVGALEPLAAGSGVGFAGVRVEVPFSLAADRTLRIAAIAADFDVRTKTDAGPVSLPIGSIELTGSLAMGCGSLTVTRATLLVPASAGAIMFHGSTVETLMGPPSETLRGVPNSAWPLELAGRAQQVDAPGLDGDAGIEP